MEDQQYEIEAILKHRKSDKGEREYRVRWKGFRRSYDSWLPEKELKV